MKRSGLRFEKFFLVKGVKLPRQKAFFTDLFFNFFTPFKRLFAPTSQSPMSKLFRFPEYLGKNNTKKWSQIGKLLLIKGVKLLHKKKFVFQKFLPYSGFSMHRPSGPVLSIS